MSKDMQRAGRPFWKWVKRIGLGLLGLLVLGCFVIVVLSKTRDAQASRVEPPTDALLIDIGGRNIYMRGLGLEHDGPTVVLIMGFTNGVSIDSGWWAGVQPALAESMRVHTFDYAGHAWSDTNPAGISHNNAADDLHAALAELDEEEVILVGMATGSNTTIFYADRYPDDPHLAGIIWIDPDVLTPELVEWYSNDLSPAMWNLLHGLNSTGFSYLHHELIVAPQNEWAMNERLSPRAEELFNWEAYDHIAARRGTSTAILSSLDHFEAYNDDLRRAASTPLPTDIPLYVVQTDMLRIQSESYPERAELNAWRGPIMEEWYRQAAENSAGGRHILISDSNHIPMLDQPDALIGAIEEMVEQVQD
jgi:pimeloyl-ACP methyl ester carboxylesterase